MPQRPPQLVGSPAAAPAPGRGLAWLPNLLSVSRAALAPAVLWAAGQGQGTLFFGLVLVAFATEVDGTVARWLGAESELGRKLDSWADLVLGLGALAGFALLHPILVAENLTFMLVGAVALLAPVAFGLVTRGEPLGYHTRLARGAGVLVGVAVIAFLAFDTMALLRMSAVVEVGVAVEYFTIATVLPGHRGEVASVAAARRLRRQIQIDTNEEAAAT